MLKRKRDIERMVGDLGLEIAGFRTDGGSHWKVDVRAPNGRQRPFIFSTNGHDGGARRDAERSMLRRWRREVWPESEVDEPAPITNGAMAQALTRALPQGALGEALRPRETITIEQAFKAVENTITTKEQTVQNNNAEQQQLSRTERASLARKGVKSNILNRPQEFKLADWLRADGRLDKTNSRILADEATKELGFQVTDSNVLGMLKDLGLEIKELVRRQPEGGGGHTTRVDYVAAVLVQLLTKMGEPVPETLRKIAAGERGLTLHDKLP